MLIETLEATKEAIEDDDKIRVSELAESVIDHFEGRRTETEAVTSHASRLSEHAEDEETVQNTVEGYFTASSNAREARMEFSQALLGYLDGEVSKEETIEVIDHIIAVESELSDSIEDVSNPDSEAELPAVLTLDVPNRIEIPKGTTVAEDVTITNRGDRADENVTIEIETDLSIAADPSTVEKVGPDETLGISLTGTVQTTGNHTGTIEVDGETTRTQADIQIVVANRIRYLEAVRPQIQDLREWVIELKEEGSPEPPEKEGLNGIINKLRTADNRVEERLEAIEEGVDEEEITEELESISNLVETVIHQAEALEGSQLGDGSVAFIIRDTEGILETLDGAIDAGQ